MKVIAASFCIIFFSCLHLFPQQINIPDQCFVNALIEDGVDSNGDGLISHAEAEAVESLYFWSECITDLKGIEAFVNLTHLYCSTNSLKRYDLSSNTRLSYLYISGLFDTLDLSHNPLVDTLISFGGQISFLDVSQCSGLRRLNMWGHELRELDLSNNPDLRALECGDNLMSELDLSACPELRSLDCHNNLLTKLDLSANKRLETINCSSNKLSRLDLPKLDSLWDFSCNGNFLHSLDLSSAPLLSFLSCSDNRLWHLDVSANLQLRLLHCGGNPMTALNISTNLALDTAAIGYGIPSLAVNHMPSLKQVCVWDLPFPPEGFIMDTIGSPNITFSTECVLGQQAGKEPKIFVYPNPARDLVHIQAGGPARKELVICSLSGSVIQKSNFEGYDYSLDISGLPSGIYLLNVKSSMGRIVEKLIKH